MSYLNILPDPSTGIAPSGKPGSSMGPGFSSISFKSITPTMGTRTNSNRLIGRAIAVQMWHADITYNPMIKSEFEPVYYFLLNKNSINPFLIRLPQYSNPALGSFSDFVQSGSLNPISTIPAGAKQITFGGSWYDPSSNGTPKQGDMLNVGDSNHSKTYQVVRVETSSDYEGVQPSSSQVRITVVPGLIKQLNVNSPLIFKEPKIKVVQSGNTNEYNLNTNNLYSFSLKVEEVN